MKYYKVKTNRLFSNNLGIGSVLLYAFNTVKAAGFSFVTLGCSDDFAVACLKVELKARFAEGNIIPAGYIICP